MKSLKMHDSQIIYLLYSFIKGRINMVLHKGDLSGKYYLCSLIINGIEKINETDCESLNDLIENNAVIYDIQIQEADNKVVIEFTGPIFWKFTIEAETFQYSEKEVTEKELDAFLDKDFSV
jgi:hypothetical protein